MSDVETTHLTPERRKFLKDSLACALGSTLALFVYEGIVKLNEMGKERVIPIALNICAFEKSGSSLRGLPFRPWQSKKPDCFAALAMTPGAFFNLDWYKRSYGRFDLTPFIIPL